MNTLRGSNLLVWSIIIVLLVAVGGYFIRGYVSGNSQGAAAAQESVVRIGFIGPMTGPFATWGESIQYGAELAAEDARHRIEIDYQDDACQAAQAVNAAQKFFNVDDIHIVIGPGCDDSLKAIMPLAKEHDALVLSTGLLGDDVFAANPTNVINLSTQVSTEAAFLAAYLRARGITSAGIIHGDNSLGQECGKRLPERLASVGIKTTIDENTSLSATDLRTTAAKIKHSEPDAVFVHQGEEQAGLFAKQFRQLNSTIPLYGMYGTESQNVITAGGAAVEGMRYTYPVNSADESAQKGTFEKRYIAKFNVSPTATSFFVYDGIMLIDKALDVCSATDGACVEKFLKQYGPYEGLSGKMEIQADGKNVRPFGIKEIKNGEFVWITKTITMGEGKRY